MVAFYDKGVTGNVQYGTVNIGNSDVTVNHSDVNVNSSYILIDSNFGYYNHGTSGYSTVSTYISKRTNNNFTLKSPTSGNQTVSWQLISS